MFGKNMNISFLLCVYATFNPEYKYSIGRFISHSLIHSFTDEHLGCFHTVATVDNTGLNLGVQVSLSHTTSMTFQFTPGSGVAK